MFPSCETLKDFIRLTDGFQTVSFCRANNIPQYVMRTRSNWLSVEFQANGVANPTSAQKGFQIYVECKYLCKKKRTAKSFRRSLKTVYNYYLHFIIKI